MIIPQRSLAVKTIEHILHKLRFVLTPPRGVDELKLRIKRMYGIVEGKETLNVMLVCAQRFVAYVFLVANLNIFQVVRFQLLEQSDDVLRIVLDVYAERRFGSYLTRERHKLNYSESFRAVTIPMTFIRRALVARSNHVLHLIFRSIYHRTAITKEREFLVHEILCKVSPVRKT